MINIIPGLRAKEIIYDMQYTTIDQAYARASARVKAEHRVEIEAGAAATFTRLILYAVIKRNVTELYIP